MQAKRIGDNTYQIEHDRGTTVVRIEYASERGNRLAWVEGDPVDETEATRAIRHAQEAWRRSSCENCAEAPAVEELDGCRMCTRCVRAALRHGHESVGHDEPIPGCPDCPAVCGHSACRQNWIDTGEGDCIEDAPTAWESGCSAPCPDCDSTGPHHAQGCAEHEREIAREAVGAAELSHVLAMEEWHRANDRAWKSGESCAPEWRGVEIADAVRVACRLRLQALEAAAAKREETDQ